MIKVKKLTKKYISIDGSEEGIIDISFDVNQGEVVCILGPSGSGKSTLLKVLSGLNKSDSGAIDFEDNATFGYVSQEYTLWPHLNVLENLVLAPCLKNKDKKSEIEKEAVKLLERFGLEKYKTSYPHDLSGGQKQRVALIRSLMVKPKILFLDEVTSSLDPELTRSILDLVRALASDGYTMLLVTHHIPFAKSIADRIFFLKSGKMIANESADDFFSNQNNIEIQSFVADITHNYKD